MGRLFSPCIRLSQALGVQDSWALTLDVSSPPV
ncbi:hypothetical protein FKM82_026851 [Ascaphus truei]